MFNLKRTIQYFLGGDAREESRVLLGEDEEKKVRAHARDPHPPWLALQVEPAKRPENFK